MELFLIRHAQSENNARPEHERVHDPSLTELGRLQAGRLAQWIPSLDLTRLISSPFLRALETTRPVHHSTGLHPEVRIHLHEQGGCYRGHLPHDRIGQPGMTREEIERRFPGYRVEVEIDGDGWWRGRDYETMDRARIRAGELLRRTVAEFAETSHRVAYVMHADVMKLFLEHLRFEGLESPFNASVTTLRLSPRETRLVQYNRIDHLPRDHVTF